MNLQLAQAATQQALYKSRKESQAKAPNALYQIKLTLSGSKPPIWRRFTVNSGIKLDKLHKVLQLVMGWENCHLYEFQEGGGRFYTRYIQPLPGWDEPLFDDWEDPFALGRGLDVDYLKPRDLTQFKLKELLFEEKAKLVYVYDMLDNWEHTLLLEKITPLTPETPKHPICLRAKGACPPEDFGGTYAYMDFLHTLLKEKPPYRKDIKERLEHYYNEDKPFDPNAYDMAEVSHQLEKIKVK
jgi:hypothetical protein